MKSKVARPKAAFLVLEDGSYFSGTGFGAEGRISGEVVFNTGMVGYPESLTDPSYNGQILVQTYPLIGNYGVPEQSGILSFESDGIKVAGYTVSELCRAPSHWQSRMGLDEWFIEEGKPGIEGIDTRALTKKLRERGVMLGILAHGGDCEIETLLPEANGIEDPNNRNLAAEVSVDEPRVLRGANEDGHTVVLIDCGTKFGIVRNLLELSREVIVVPWDTPAEKILGYNPSGILAGNGPGNPKTMKPTIAALKSLVEYGLPVLGICFGNQLLALALGGDTYKLRFGHRSQNQPCLDLETGRCYITTQNHGFAVDQKRLPAEVKVWAVNANDGTVEGIRHSKKPVVGFQAHPEACPGPNDANFLFERFGKWMEDYKK